MSSDYHIKFDGVEGEATHKDHKGEIEILSWSWEVSQPTAKGGGGTGRGKAEAGSFIFAHNYDRSSPLLGKHCAAGKHFATAVLTARKAGEGQKDFLKVTLKEVFITGVKPSAVADGGITEEVRCAYKDIEFAYKPQDDKGALGGEIKFGWAVATTETR
jgi:type VI secretion system secreted protein Hcp